MAIPALRSLLRTPEFGRGLEGFRRHFALELKSCGVKALDQMLGGGFPCGSVVELCGTACSGRTSLSLALLAQATRRQEACALVDVSDCFDPESAAAAGVDLERLLWIRCGGEGNVESSRAFASVARESGQNEKSRASERHAASAKLLKGGHGWRSEERRVGKSVELGGRRISKKKKCSK